MIPDYEINPIALKKMIENKNIAIFGIRAHSKASEVYVDVKFSYPKQKTAWKGSVPIEYRRTGVSARTEEEIAELLEKTHKQMNPKNYKQWLREQSIFWDSTRKKVTREFFEKLKDFDWKCVYCELPRNPNWARRIQDIKEFGYTLATNTNMFCKKCNKKTTHLIMLPLSRGHETGYEILSPKLRRKILRVLNNFDVFESRRRSSLLPDHKFPEIRWDEKTREENLDDMTEEQIRKKFQLLSNRRNQQKREVCRKCYQMGKRGFPHGIKFFYVGDENWPKRVPKRGKEAERECCGCGWYDMTKWKEELNRVIKKYS